MKFFENLNFSKLFSKKKIDDKLLDKFEELLIESDVGTEIASELKEKFKKEKIGKEIKDEKEIFEFLGNQISKILEPHERKFDDLNKNSPTIIVVAGVNGVGKTTTIGKLGRLFKNSGKKTDMIEKISAGKIKKFISDNTLLNQVWIMDTKMKVNQVIKQHSAGEEIKVLDFVRFKVGEGID